MLRPPTFQLPTLFSPTTTVWAKLVANITGLIAEKVKVFCATSFKQTPFTVKSLNWRQLFKWKYFPRHCPFARGLHWSPVNPPHKGQWHGSLMFSLICPCINGWVNNRKAGDWRRYCAQHDVIVMGFIMVSWSWNTIIRFQIYSGKYFVTLSDTVW